MRTKCTFLTIALVTLLCLPAAVLAQQTIELPPNVVNGGETFSLNSASRLGITAAELKKLSETLAEGATIELLKPVNSTAKPKALVISKVRWTGEFAAVGIQKVLNGGETIQRQLQPHGTNPPVEYIIPGSLSATIVLHNTTKSRIDLQGWQLRITHGAIPDETEAAIDRVSSVGAAFPQTRRQDTRELILVVEPQGEISLPPRSFSMTRKIDYANVNDPGKTRAEQLSGIPDGINPESWEASTEPEFAWIEIHNGLGTNDWIELRNTTDEPLELHKWLFLIHPEEATPRDGEVPLIEER